MRNNLKELLGKEISGTAKCIKKGHCYLLKNVFIKDISSFIPNTYLLKESHLWVKSKNIEKDNIERCLFYEFIGTVYEYKRRNDTIDYSINIKKLIPIDLIECCKYKYYNIQFSNKNKFVASLIENLLIKEYVDEFREKHNFALKDFFKEIKKKTSFRINDSNIYLGMYKSDFVKRYKNIIIDKTEFGYKLNPIQINNFYITPIIHFLCNNICDAIIFEFHQADFNSVVNYINEKFNTNVIKIKQNISFLDLFKIENESGEVVFSYIEIKNNYPLSLVVSLTTVASNYLIEALPSNKEKN